MDEGALSKRVSEAGVEGQGWEVRGESCDPSCLQGREGREGGEGGREGDRREGGGQEGGRETEGGEREAATDCPSQAAHYRKIATTKITGNFKSYS